MKIEVPAASVKNILATREVLWAVLGIYILMFIFLVLFGFYILTYVLFLVSFLLLAMNLPNLRFLRGVESRPLFQRMFFLFTLALFLRIVLLAQNQMLTRDLEVYVLRSNWMMAGQTPYEDFAVNKPPLYAFMLHFLGLTVGAGEAQFRAVFSFADALLVVVLFFLARCRYDTRFSFRASFLYAICPLPIVSIGLSGHYEPVVMLFILSSMYLLFKEKYEFSALLLGIGFALKFFPVVLLPFFAWRIRSWNRRFLYIVLFSVPMILSVIPMFITSSSAFSAYMYEQGYSWEAKKSFAYSVELITGSSTFMGLTYTFLFQILFLGVIFIMFLSWIKKRFDAAMWFRLVVLTYLVYYGLFIMASIIFYASDLGLADPRPATTLFAVVYFGAVFIFLYRYLPFIKIETEKKEEMFLLAAFALIFMMFGSGQYNIWYALWFLPFILVVKSERIRLIILWLMFWSFEGMGIVLFPGMALA